MEEDVLGVDVEMKNFYYLSDRQNTEGESVIHTMNCVHVPSLPQRTIIGLASSGSEAVRLAKRSLIQPKRRLVLCPVCCTEDMRQRIHLLE
ncbi:hypothetical protein [Enterococcus sp. 5H]|uniref:hypothetical protein n=1 Tax=Enterococcus sp. 5H TaxID=1229490 RepID=UPI00230278F7|nr:hypothetical protein [Enterococcus sp. 5H]MDA9470556.1 hypothetical protein [Enterococcus sp. 5H]